MTERDVKIVVAEGPSGRKGLLRFVLESEGYLVVGEASTSADLAQALETHHPDVVVMDDGIGATAVGMTHDLAPAAKVILVWPEAVVPIGGDAAVEPSSVLRSLGPTVERLTGAPSVTGRVGLTKAGAAGAVGLGAILAMGRAAGTPGTSPADLPTPVGSDPSGPIIDTRGETPVLILPEDADADPVAAPTPESEGVDAAIAGPLTLAELDAAERSGAAPVPRVGAVAGVAAAAAVTSGAAAAAKAAPRSARDRRIGTLALGGAALAGSLVLALALSGSRVPAGGVRGEGPGVSSPPPITASPVVPPPQAVAIPGALLGDLGGNGTTLTFVTTDAVPGIGSREGTAGSPNGDGGGGGSGGPTPPIGSGGSGGGSGSAGSGGGGGGSGGTGGTGSGGSGGSSGGGGSFAGTGGGGQGTRDCDPRDHDPGTGCETNDDGLDQHGPGDHHHGHDPGYSDHGHDGDHGDGHDHDGQENGDHGHDSDEGHAGGHGGSDDHGGDQGYGDHEHDGDRHGAGGCDDHGGDQGGGH